MAMKTKTHRGNRSRAHRPTSTPKTQGSVKTERTINQTIAYLQKAQEALTKLQDVLSHANAGTRASRGGAHAPVKPASTPRHTKTQRRNARPASHGASKAVRYSKWIDTVDDHEDRPGQSLATQNHDVIMQWAEERGAVPATVPGTEHEHRPGVLRLNFPGYGGQDLKEISWDEWFEPFDERGLIFVYQEHKTDGSLSNFFRLDNPDRED